MYHAFIIGAGPAGLQCALVLGSAKNAAYAQKKNIGIVMHQKASHLQSALLNNVLGVAPGTKGSTILKEGKEQLEKLYPHVHQIENEKVLAIDVEDDLYTITTNKSVYDSYAVVVALGYTDMFEINGLKQFLEPHAMSPANKNRVQLQNTNYVVKSGLYVAGTLAGGRSQFAIAAGSGAQVATDILTEWNNGNHTKVHDKIV
ncbi:NAD(P)/FAD-dependent oxidoreductase [Joostella sp. CR20]|uniref:FAD-dependent oxidoreductase n=1 Tax=Joostella sp. CR20 TaxID=2804312 RepID=UPI00313EACEE